MNTLIKVTAVAAFAAFAIPVATQAAVPSSATQNVPGMINYQGVLRNPADGAAYADGIYTLELRIWSNSSSTSQSACLWGGLYSVYVKDGYFNVMLGDTSGKNLSTGVTPTYGNADLWKAMWGASDTSTTYYLGVTPHEDYRGASITSPTEILPRQQLLSSPFAFRAQQAKYADNSKATTFTAENNLQVNGTTTLKGNVTINGTITANNTSTTTKQQFGPIQTTASAVYLGNGATSATTSLPKIYDVGSFLYFHSYYSMYFSTQQGSATFTIPSSYKAYFTGSGSFVSDLPTTVIGGSGTTLIMGKPVTIQYGSGTSSAKITVNSASTTVTNTTVNVQGGSVVNLSGATVNMRADSYVRGQGYFKWAPYGKTLTSGEVMPFYLKTVSVTIAAGKKYATNTVETDANYSWCVVGYEGPTDAVGPNEIEAYKNSSSWIVRVFLGSAATASQTWKVQLLGIHKNFSYDGR